MLWHLTLGALVCLAAAHPQQENTKNVKGGHYPAQFQQVQLTNLIRRFDENATYERGVCYIEVPTVSLFADLDKIPVGNGSRPDLSRIRSCCEGYIRNIHNFKLCDPVCKEDCVNGLCTAPNVCTCFPDHVRNLGGFCIPTCPIGCQHGICEGGDCICYAGFKLDADRKFCMPICDHDCGGLGNCTEPNSCECKPGYKTTADGNCQPACHDCAHGDCVSPNVCRCHPGYALDKRGGCVPSCPRGCGNGICIAPNVCSGDTVLEVQPVSGIDPASLTSVCSRPCLNGVCAPGNRCACNAGYILDRDDPTGSRCIPSCPGGCTNGVCSAPNRCLCNIGYVKDNSVKGRPVCVRRSKRSADDEQAPSDIANFDLIFEIPDDQ